MLTQSSGGEAPFAPVAMMPAGKHAADRKRSGRCVSSRGGAAQWPAYAPVGDEYLQVSFDSEARTEDDFDLSRSDHPYLANSRHTRQTDIGRPQRENRTFGDGDHKAVGQPVP
jgi:hypothetical protein